ncbi:glycosyltransferase family 2 protein [uncultured Croceicoccus sp.]|uniref:glycosyltransferase n=1 Tax=uncultured Croceicoccus sp. TaxID=1295329 RepID=UPI00261BEA55|nr:glycosyltransferase family 2 protein [uncultured Croceicoccus sp.]
MLDLAIILPTLNEAANIASFIARLADTLGPAGWEVIVVDDDSGDGTADAARRIARADTRVRVIQRIGRRGLASAAIEGMLATAAPYVAVMDADHQHDPALLLPMLRAMEGGDLDLCIASRFAPGASTQGWAAPEREARSHIANRIARAMTGIAATDPMSGFFMIRADLLRTLAPRLSGIGFKILLDILATAPAPLRLREFPMDFTARTAGESKLDRAIAFDFLIGVYDRTIGRVLPTRFALFGTIGAVGVAVHLAILWLFHKGAGTDFLTGQIAAVTGALTFNFVLNNALTYADQRLSGVRAMLAGWARFAGTCAIGAGANVAVAEAMAGRGFHWLTAALAGIVVGSVWNFALSSRFVWGRF